jgi:peptide/nickel transport system ATP-binding protein
MLRGRRVALMLQNPRASLDPSYTIGSQIVETLMAHGLASDRADAKRQAMVLLAQMDFDDIERVFRSYRHQLSGGMCQRALLALTLACAPRILIVDEPTASLDMAVRGQIIALLRSLNETTGLPILIITHDIGVVESIASRMLVMYAGHVQEEGDCETLLKRPLHPYTQALLGAVATPDHPKGALRQIMGEAPILTLEMLGCRFADRCDFVMDICRKNLPSLVEVFPGHRVRCHLHLINEENAS